MNQIAPWCQWHSFREWAVTLMSCQASTTHQQRLTRAHTHLVTTANLFHTILKSYKLPGKAGPIVDDMYGEGLPPQPIELMGVCEIIYWMLTIQDHIGAGIVAEGKWGPAFLPQDIVEPAVDSFGEG